MELNDSFKRIPPRSHRQASLGGRQYAFKSGLINATALHLTTACEVTINLPIGSAIQTPYVTSIGSLCEGSHPLK